MLALNHKIKSTKLEMITTLGTSNCLTMLLLKQLDKSKQSGFLGVTKGVMRVDCGEVNWREGVDAGVSHTLQSPVWTQTERVSQVQAQQVAVLTVIVEAISSYISKIFIIQFWNYLYYLLSKFNKVFIYRLFNFIFVIVYFI